jgi:iron complex transport system substrate-binding protein
MRFLFLISFVFFGCNSLKKKDVVDTNGIIKYASNFKIEQKEGLTFLKIIDPETNKTEIQYFLKKKGQEDQKGFISIEVPIKSIAALSSTHIGMLNKIDALDVITVISDTTYIDNSFIKEKTRSNKVKSIGSEGLESVESIIHSQVNVVMFSGFGKPFSHQDKLENLGIICIPNYDWREIHPLGKAEWIKLFGYLVGKEKQATDYMTKIENEYFDLVHLAKKSVSASSLFCGNLVGDIWYTPAGESYNAQLFKDANIDYKYKDSKGTGSLQKSFEEILIDNQHTDFWFNPGFESFSRLIQEQPKMKYFKSVKTHQVYDYTSKMNFYWENSAIEPQKVLSDFIQIFHPELLTDKKLYFYSKLKE